MDQNIAVIASFSLIQNEEPEPDPEPTPDPTPTEYTLTVVTVGEGSVSSGNQSYSEGTAVDLEALTGEGWIFCRWTGDASGTTNTTVTMDVDKTVTAYFLPDYKYVTLLDDFSLSSPYDVAVDSLGNVYVTDTGKRPYLRILHKWHHCQLG